MRRPNGGAKKQDIDTPQMPGGAAGNAVSTEPQVRQQQGAVPIRLQERARTAQKYMIVDGPRDAQGKVRLNMDGYVCGLTPGKIVDETTYPLALLKSQGIRLEVIPDEVIGEDEGITSAADAEGDAGSESDSDSDDETEPAAATV